jgi:hypothetical protein
VAAFLKRPSDYGGIRLKGWCVRAVFLVLNLFDTLGLFGFLGLLSPQTLFSPFFQLILYRNDCFLVFFDQPADFLDNFRMLSGDVVVLAGIMFQLKE